MKRTKGRADPSQVNALLELPPILSSIFSKGHILGLRGTVYDITSEKITELMK